jgi:hypothetical protein
VKRKKAITPEMAVYRNPVFASVVRAQIKDSIARVKRGAELQALYGDAASNLIKDAGVLLFAVAHACGRCGVDPECADVRIARGMAMALGQLGERIDALEAHRPAIQAGLSAVERLLPALATSSLGDGLLACRARIADNGFGTDDIHRLFGVAADA